MPETNSNGPIFIGGTGRSGTSVMADVLNSHPAIVLPAHENKLIVERHGLRDLVDQLSARFDLKRHHYAVADFIAWARKLRTLGFRDAKLNERVKGLMQTEKMGFHRACEVVARDHPGADLAIHAIGQGFDLAHYDSTVNGFLRRLCLSVSEEGIVEVEGLIRPFITPRQMDRPTVLEECRRFLEELYAVPLGRAGATRWCDDSPDNWMYLDFLLELFPDMRFIHLIRDPRDVVGSYMKQIWAPSDPKAIVATFKAQFADYEAVKARTPANQVMEVRMEDLTADRERVMSEVAAFLGVEPKFNLGLFRAERTNTGSYAEIIGVENLALIERELGGWMRKHRYLEPAA